MGSNKKKGGKKKKGGGSGGGKKKSSSSSSSSSTTTKPNANAPPPPISLAPSPSSNGAASATTAWSIASRAPPHDPVHRLCAELYTLTRSLLSSMAGCAPDGRPLSVPEHPLAKLHAQLLLKVEELRVIQRKSNGAKGHRTKRGGRPEDAIKEGMERLLQVQSSPETRREGAESKSADQEKAREDPRTWSAFQSWLEHCHLDIADYPIEIRPSVVVAAAEEEDGAEEETIHNNRQPEEDGSAREYGLFATRDIYYDETVLRIPLELMVCPYFENVSESSDKIILPPPPFDPLRPTVQDVPLRPLCLVTHLVQHKYLGSQSPLAPYINTLPPVPSPSCSTPICWSLDEVRSLAHTAHLKRAVMMQAKLVWDYLQAREMIDRTHREGNRNSGDSNAEGGLIPTQDFTFDLFRWATVTSHTRQNLLPFPIHESRRLVAAELDGDGGDTIEGGAENGKRGGAKKQLQVEQAHGLVPLWDLLNHEDSGRACVTDVVFEPRDSEDSNANDDSNNLRAVLVCRTPSNAPKANVPCFHKGEEITMHYGPRSNAQLLYHSGFVNCTASALEDIVENARNTRNATENGGDGNISARKKKINLNRTDCAILRVALPPAEDDQGLDRIREMVAARFGFKAYTDQGCAHDGLSCAQAAAGVLRDLPGGDNSSSSNNNETQRKSGMTRKAAEVVMAEFAVSPDEILPEGLLRALMLCVADKEELTHLLRNMDAYVNSAEIGSLEVLQLGKKHLDLAAKLVDIQIEKFDIAKKEKALFCGDKSKLALKLALCDQETLSAWFDAFRSQVPVITNGDG